MNGKKKKVSSKTITPEQIEETNKYVHLPEGSRELPMEGYAFYYNQIQNNLDLCDADRYANLNTVLGYDVGIRKFRSLDAWLWEHNFDLMSLTGTEEDRETLEEATRATHTKPLDFSKWRDLSGEKYTYSYF